MDIIYRTGKHWISYFQAIVAYFIIVGGIVWILYYLNSGNNSTILKTISNVYPVKESIIHLVVNYLLVGVIIILSISFIYGLLKLKSIKFSIYDGVLNIRGGVLPWKKINLDISFDQIFNASASHSFFGWLFKYGTIHVQGKEGITSHTVESHIKNATRLQAEINSLLG